MSEWEPIFPRDARPVKLTDLLPVQGEGKETTLAVAPDGARMRSFVVSVETMLPDCDIGLG